MKEGSVIKVNGLTKRFKLKQKEPGIRGSLKAFFSPKYKEIVAVDNIDLDIKKGEIVGFIGPNGAGKSTTIKMLSGILYPTSGDISVLGFNPQKDREKLAYHIGTIFGQKPQLWYHLPPIDTFNLFSKIYELEQKEYEERLDRLVKMFEIEDLMNVPVRKMSLGQRMRCELVGSLLHKPKVIFLDEPTIGLDIIVKKNIRKLIEKLNEEEQITVILTSHDMDDIEQICDRIIIINYGKIIYKGSIKDAREKFLVNKVIEVHFNNEIKDFKLKNAKIIYKNKDKVKFEIDTSKFEVKKVMELLVSKYDVKDINISDPPIEEIIECIYKEGLEYGKEIKKR